MIALLFALNLNALASGPEPLAIPSILESQELGDGLDIALPDEVADYKALGGNDENEDEKRRFRALFWTRRDPDTGSFDNPVRELLLTRAAEADRRFGTAKTPGRRTDPGRTLVLLGEPEKIESDQGKRFVRFRYAADRTHGSDAVELTFEDTSGKGELRLAHPEEGEQLLLEAKRAFVVSPGISYETSGRSLPAPDVSGVEWQELETLEESYQREGKKPDFPLAATLDVVRAGREKGRVLIDVDLDGSALVRPKAGTGDERYVTIAGTLENRDRGISYPLRDLAVLRGASDHARIRLQLEIDPGDYEVNLLAKEPLLSLFSYRHESIRVPDYQAAHLETSSLVVGARLSPEEDNRDLPLELRAGDLAIDPRPGPVRGEWYALTHVYGAKAPVEIDIALDGKLVQPARLTRSGGADDQTLVAAMEASGRRVVVRLTDPSTGLGTVLVRDLDGGSTLPPMASRRARPEDFGQAATERVTLLTPRASDNPVSVTSAEAERQGEGSIAFFLDGSLAMIATQAPYKVPMQAITGRSQMAVAALPLDATGLAAAGPSTSVTLQSRTPVYLVRTTLVPVYASVVDPAKKRFVTDLPREAFVLEEDGHAQSLTHFERDTDDPMTVAFVVDESLDMAPYLDVTRVALAELASSLRDVDQGFVVGFNRQVALHTDLTGCKGCLVAGILGTRYLRPDREVNSSGRLMDALEAATFRLSTRDGRKIVLLATHGNDSGSRIGADRIADLARRFGVMVYALGVNINAPVSHNDWDFITKDPSKTEKALKGIGLGKFYAKKDEQRADIKDRFEDNLRSGTTLEALAGASGGRAYLFESYSGTAIDTESAIRALRNELAHQYFLGYSSTDTTSRGLREIKIALPGKDYRVRGRTAYVPE